MQETGTPTNMRMASATYKAASARSLVCGVLRLRQKEKEDPQNQVDREKLDAFDPVRLTVFAYLKQDVNRSDNRQNFRHREFQIHRPPKNIGQKNHHRRDE